MKKYIKYLTYSLIALNATFANADVLTNKAALEAKVDTFIANEETIGEVVKMISISSNVPIIATPEASIKEVSCHFKNLPLEVCLESLCRANGLWLNVSSNGVLTISTIQQELSSREFYTEDYIEIITVKYPSVLDVGDTIKGLYRDRIVWLRPDDDADDPYQRLDQAMGRMDLLSERSQFGISNNSGSSSSSSSSSRNSDEYDNNDDQDQFKSLKQTREVIEGDLLNKQAQKSLKGLDSTQDAQAFHSRTQSSLVYLSILTETNTIMVRSTDRRAAETIAKAIKDIDKPRGQVLLKVSVLSVDLGDGSETGINWSFNSGNFSGGFTTNAITAFADAAATSTSPAGAAVTFITNSVAAQIKALKEANKVKELSNPTLFVADNEAANVFVGTSSKFLDQIEPGEVSMSDGVSVSTDPSPTLVERQIGVSLIITPRVHADRTVTLRILQERSNIDDTPRTINYGTSSSGTELNLEVSDIDEETVVSTLVAKDGESVILGGMIRDKITIDRSGIPVLMDIPYIGDIFAYNSRKKERSELIVIIEPYVIAVPGESGAASAKVLEELKVNMKSPLQGEDMIIDGGSYLEKLSSDVGKKEDIGQGNEDKSSEDQNKSSNEKSN